MDSLTSLHTSAFALLGANPRDDRRRIVELAEARSLSLDSDTCQKARADLTNPRTRLGAELGWLPGVSPRRASSLVDLLLRDPMAVRNESGLPALARANLMAAAFESAELTESPGDVAAFMQEFANVVEQISLDDIRRDINEDRAVSGFPEIRLNDQIADEFAERKRHYRNAIRTALDRLPSLSLVDALTRAMDGATSGGKLHAPELLDELVDTYAVETQSFLENEAGNAKKLIEAIRQESKLGHASVTPLIGNLEAVARNWDKVAQPIQLSAKARGIDHDASKALGYAIRNLAVDLFNEHNMLEECRRLTDLLKELFSEVPELLDRVDSDTVALANIAEQRERSEHDQKKWREEVSFRAEIGVVFKNTLSISPEGISWKNTTFPLASITRVRWGGLRRSINGIPTGTEYVVAFGDGRTESVVTMQRQGVFNAFIEKLWKAVCSRILTDLLAILKQGHELRIGEAVVRDSSIVLVNRRLFGKNEAKWYAWSQVTVRSAGGSVFFTASDDKKTYVSLSYLDISNAHILEQIVLAALKRPGLTRLSQLLD